MNKVDYFQLTTERIHQALNFRQNHRFFLIYGKNTTDEFLTSSFYRASLRQTLWATLKENQIQRVIFYNAAEKFFFLDEESQRLASKLENSPTDNRAAAFSVNTNRRQVGPLGANRNVLRQTSTAKASEPGSSPISNPDSVPNKDGIIPMTRTRTGGGMSDSMVLTHFNDFFTDNLARTAIVIEELENLSRIDDGIKRELVARMRNWSAMTTDNRNVMIFITDREPDEKEEGRALQRFTTEFPVVANLINIALGKKESETEGFILYVPTPYKSEVERLLNEQRVTYKLPVNWDEFDSLTQQLTVENFSLKHLAGKLRESMEGWNKNTPLSLMTAKEQGWLPSNPDFRSANNRLEELIGLTQVKEQVNRFIKSVKAEKKRRLGNPTLSIKPPSLHLMFTGNPGSGKTEVARLMGEIYRDAGLLRRGHTIEAHSNSLIAEHVGGSASITNARISEAIDGVLFIDEAYLLNDNTSFGEQSVGIITARMENERHRLGVILAGYPEEMNALLAKNAGLRGRVHQIINFTDYLPDELLQIFEFMIKHQGFFIDDANRPTFLSLFVNIYKSRANPEHFPPDEKGKSSYDNARMVRTFIDKMIEEQAMRLDGEYSPELTLADIPTKYRQYLQSESEPSMETDLKQLLENLDAFVGLQEVKDFVHGLIEEQQLGQMGINLTSMPMTRHMLFTGNPGTGKTSIAALIGEIFKTLGILEKGHFVSVKRQHLVAEYLGQTAPLTNKVIESALDGVLFIDEAYSLARDKNDPYGTECIDTLTPLLEEYRDRLVVIFAGYTKEMQIFLDANSGMESRFGYKIEFPDYTPHELMEIFVRMAAKDKFTVAENTRLALFEEFSKLFVQRGVRHGNARDVRVKFYEKMLIRFRRRLFSAVKSGINSEDFPKVFTIEDLPIT